MDNNLPTDDNQKPVTPVETPPPGPETPSVIPETPEETPSTIPTPVIEETPPITLPEEPKQETPEPTIEIGFLGQPSLSTIQDFGGKSSNKSKKIKTVASVLGVLLIITALPLALVLVKQRQEIRKEAQDSSSTGVINACGVIIDAGTSDNSNSSLTTNFNFNNTSGRSITMQIHLYGCACNDGNLGQCGTESGDCSGDERNITVPTGTSSQSITTPSKNNCGTFQTDLFVISCN